VSDPEDQHGRGALRSGTRQLLIGGAAAVLVFGIGHLIGASAAP
jgi:VIT1/CCC1 family predicted Fe2+/Mn2+ transporter